MGFRLPVEVTTLTLRDGPWAGVEVALNAASAPRAQLIGLLTAPENETEEQQTARGRELFTLLETRVIVGWNVESHAGKPIPPTADGFALVPPELIAAVIAQYLTLT